METKDVQALAAMVFQFGPFALSILFVFLVSRQCNAQYQKSVSREHPPPTGGELWMYRSFFIVSFFIGCGLTIYSVVWWSNAQDRLFVYEFRVVSVDTNRRIRAVSPVIAKAKPAEQEDGTVLYDFVVINAGPFIPGQKFAILLAEDPSASGGVGAPRQELELVWAGKPHQTFRVKKRADAFQLEVLQ